MEELGLRRASLVVAVLALLGNGACLGRIGESGQAGGGANGGVAGSSGGGTAGTQPGTSGTGGSSTVVPIPTDGKAPAESAGPLLMRRLTYREYDHMLAELLGDTTAPAEGGNAWSPEAPNDLGYVTPTSVADLQVDLYRQTADSIVDAALQAVASGKPAGKLVIPCSNPSGAAAESSCATSFITTFGLQAYRRPVTSAEQADLLSLFTKVRGLGLTFTASIGAIVKGMLQSPNFLYHWEIGPTRPAPGSDGLLPLTGYQMASRLAAMLWESMPDDNLLQAAQAGQLGTPSAVAAQVTRMLGDARASNGLFNFHAQWLFTFGSQGRDLSQPLNKSSARFTDAVAQGVQTEFSTFLASVYTGDGTLQSLFTAPYTFVNRDLAAIYGVQGPSTGFAKVSLDPTQRAGLLTQTAFLGMLASDVVDNPVYRGLSVYLKILCGEVGNPPPIVPPVNFIANGTTRQSYDAHGMAACASGCHNRFDPPGFAFENYDGIGAYRTTEAGQPVDATGSFVTPGQNTITFKNAVDLAKQLASSGETRACLTRQWTRYLIGRAETAAEVGSMSVAYRKAAGTEGFSLRDLLVSLAQSKAFMYRQPSAGETL